VTRIASLMVVVAALGCAPRLPAAPPNVVVLLADDLGYADIGPFGAKGVRTPNLDRMAAEGTKLTSFCVSQAVCTASRASLMSGCYANRVGLAGALNHESRVGISPDETLLPELLKAKGYATAIYGKWHLGDRPKFLPTRHGFDDWAGLPYSNDNGPLHPVVRTIPPLPWYENGKVVATDPDQSTFTKTFTDRAVRFIEANKDRPFFLYVPHVMPHVPIFASDRFKGKSGRGVYGDVVEELDWGVGEVLAALKRTGVDENTLVLFYSDNGPFLSYGAHAGRADPLREGKLTAYEGGVRVPAIVRWPGKVPAGRTSNELVTSLDLLPTICKLVGADVPAKPIDGKDIGPFLLGEANAPDRPFYLYSGDELHAVRVGKWKLHLPHDYLTVAGPPGENGKPANFAAMKPASMAVSGIRGIASRHGYAVKSTGQALYDLDADPGEATDVSASHPDAVKRLLDYAEAARVDLGDSLTKRTGTGVRSVGRD
jgi:arylsulfatase A-like enzyme